MNAMPEVRKFALWLAAPGAFVLASAVAAAMASASAPTRQTDTRTFEEVGQIESRGHRHGIFADDHAYLKSKQRPAHDVLAIEPFILAGSQTIIVDRAATPEATGPHVPSGLGRRLHSRSFEIFAEQIESTLKNRLGLDSSTAETLAGEIERQALLVAKVDIKAYQTITGRKIPTLKAAHDAAIAAVEKLHQTSTLIASCDVPYLAGYDYSDGSLVLIDRSIPLKKKMNGVEVPVGKLLNIHERVEKAILDDYQTTYPHAHQIALRLEKLASDALRLPWKAYDDFITRASEAIDSRPVEKVYNGLDFSPYLTWNSPDDVKLVETMRSSFVELSDCPAVPK